MKASLSQKRAAALPPPLSLSLLVWCLDWLAGFGWLGALCQEALNTQSTQAFKEPRARGNRGPAAPRLAPRLGWEILGFRIF